MFPAVAGILSLKIWWYTKTKRRNPANFVLNSKLIDVICNVKIPKSLFFQNSISRLIIFSGCLTLNVQSNFLKTENSYDHSANCFLFLCFHSTSFFSPNLPLGGEFFLHFLFFFILFRHLNGGNVWGIFPFPEILLESSRNPLEMPEESNINIDCHCGVILFI